MPLPPNGGRRWSTPAVVLTLATTVLGQLFFAIWWAKGESGRITAVEVAIVGLRSDIFSLNTPLSSKVLKMEVELTSTARRMLDIAAALDRVAERLILLDRRAVETEGRSSQSSAAILEKMNGVDKRLDVLDKRLSDHLMQQPYRMQSDTK